MATIKPQQEWFDTWTSTLEAVLEPYREIWVDTGLRPAEIQVYVEYEICAQIIRHAMRHHEDAWREAPKLLQSERPLREVLGLLFGNDIPVPVAAMALDVIVQDSEEHDERQDVLIGREVRKRESERAKVAPPRCLWVVRILGAKRFSVTVESRARLKDRSVGLIRIVDAR